MYLSQCGSFHYELDCQEASAQATSLLNFLTVPFGYEEDLRTNVLWSGQQGPREGETID